MPAPRPTRQSEFHIAFACLAHPFSLLALGLLALNDHWWKGVGPAWVTGKLSDFAGLFYFPYLVILLVALVVGGRPARARMPVGRFVFWSVGLWFAAAKSIPLVHAVTVDFAEAMVGRVNVVRDPLDALAIIALAPAWLLYRRQARTQRRPVARTIQPAVLGLALLLTAATSKPRIPAVNRLVNHEGQLYAVVGDDPEFDASSGQVFSTANGIEWERSDLPEAVIQSHQPRTELKSGDLMFRLSGREVMAVNAHGLESAWNISDQRQDFMLVAGSEPWWSAVDIAPVPNAPGTLVVALGPEGIVVRSAHGRWTRHGIGPVRPTPQQVSLDQALTLVFRGQWAFGAAATLIAWVLMSFLAWCAAPRIALPAAQSRKGGLAANIRSLVAGPFRALTRIRFDERYLGTALAGVVWPCLLFGLHLLPRSSEWISFMAIPCLALSFLAVALGWLRYKKSFPHGPRRTHLLAALASGLVSLAMLILWDIGWIESLTLAFVLATCAVLGVVWARALTITGGSA